MKLAPISSLADHTLGGRLLADGAATLTNAELLATILVTDDSGENALQLAERVIARERRTVWLSASRRHGVTRDYGLGR